MKTIFLALAAVLILSGVGAGAYFYLDNAAEAAGIEGERVTEARQKPKNENFEFVELDPLVLPIIDSNGVTQTVSLVVMVEVADAQKAEIVKRMAPRLKDAFIQDMYGTLSKQAAMTGGVVQVSVIKERLMRISERVLGQDIVQDILLQVVQQRRV